MVRTWYWPLLPFTLFDLYCLSWASFWGNLYWMKKLTEWRNKNFESNNEIKLIEGQLSHTTSVWMFKLQTLMWKVEMWKWVRRKVKFKSTAFRSRNEQRMGQLAPKNIPLNRAIPVKPDFLVGYRKETMVVFSCLQWGIELARYGRSKKWC